MFQIVSTLMEEVPDFALRMRELRGEQPQMQFVNDPWVMSRNVWRNVSDRTGAFVHCLIPKLAQTSLTPRDNIDDSEEMAAGFTFRDDCGYLGVGRAGSISLCRRDRAHMAGYYWQSMYGGRLAY